MKQHHGNRSIFHSVLIHYFKDFKHVHIVVTQTHAKTEDNT